MNRRLRHQRSVFFAFVGACFIASMAALPIVKAQTQPAQKKETEARSASAASGATAAASDFERADRNRDGFIDKSEAAVVPGLSANFERADRSRDGKLDPQEFAKGLEILQVRR